MRQLESVTNLDSRKSSVKQEKETTYNIHRTHVSQSAPHTPVSGPLFENDGVYLKAVPRLLSEPLVSATTPNNVSPGLKSLESGDSKRSPFFKDKKIENSSVDVYLKSSFNQTKINIKNAQINNIAPVHSPKMLNYNDSMSSLIKKDTKIQLEMPKNSQAKLNQNNNDVDATDL